MSGFPLIPGPVLAEMNESGGTSVSSPTNLKRRIVVRRIDVDVASVDARIDELIRTVRGAFFQKNCKFLQITKQNSVADFVAPVRRADRCVHCKRERRNGGIARKGGLFCVRAEARRDDRKRDD